MHRICLIFLLIITTCSISKAQSTSCPDDFPLGDYPESVQRGAPKISRMTKSSCLDAARLLIQFRVLIDRLEDDINDIASSDLSASRRASIAKNTIDDFFESSRATVQVSNINEETLIELTVKEYFDRLSSHAKRYDKVYISFESGQSFDDIRRISSTNDYEALWSVWQVFQGERDGMVIYSDATRKKFRLQVSKLRGGKWDLKIKEISVIDTVTIKEYLASYK